MNLRELALQAPLDERSMELRKLILNSIAHSGRGHIGPSLSLLEIISTLYDSILTHDPKIPDWENRDFFILSKGHGCLGLFAVLAQHGYFPVSELNTFCSYESRLGGHPEWHELPGIEFSTGSLGHGLSVASGIAMALRIDGYSQRRVFVLLGDGELGEGSIWESLLHIAKHKLTNLTTIIDYNNMQANGNIDEVLPLGDLSAKFLSFGFEVIEINGHSREEIITALTSKSITKPKLVIAYTVKGKGLPAAENSSEWHHKAKIGLKELEKLAGFEK